MAERDVEGLARRQRHHGTISDVPWGFACLFLGPELTARFADLVRATAYTPGAPPG